MNTKQQLHIRVGQLTQDQLAALGERTGMGKGEIIALAIDRMWQLELSKSAALDDCDQPGWW